MASNPPSPQKSRKSAVRPVPISPAQAIADAWKRESVESQERWRKLDTEMRRRYEDARRKQAQSKM
ncbi:hypothetical protein AN958_03022 [Leucoagaricus sp. SymC.cos]|nr:hypothetical protein AN958_03022 [Leucoagaricus sp. SymC.cos]